MDTTLGKIYKIMNALRETKIHLGDDDFSVENFKTNGQLLFTIANSCLHNRMLLLYGGMGANKTTLINVIGSRLCNVPYGDMVSTMIAGHPEQTEEKMIGFIDPRQWMSKYEDGDSIKVIWTKWAKSRWKVIDELNRFPPGKQNLFHDILRAKQISYSGQTLKTEDCRMFATMNPEFKSTYPLDEALLDRVSVCIPIYQPPFKYLLDLLSRPADIEGLVESVPTLNDAEFNSLPEMVDNVRFPPVLQVCTASLIRDFVILERAPNNDKTQLTPSSKPSKGLCTRYTKSKYYGNLNIVSWQVDEGLSVRALFDIRDFTKAIAFLRGSNEATIADLKAVAPYVIWHRVTPNETVYNAPPYYGADKLKFISDLVEKSINTTLNERAEINTIFAQANDGMISTVEGIRKLANFEDPLCRFDMIKFLENKKK